MLRVPYAHEPIDWRQIAAATLFTISVAIAVFTVPELLREEPDRPPINPRGDGSIYMMPLPQLVFSERLRSTAALGVDGLVIETRLVFSQLAAGDPVRIAVHLSLGDRPIPQVEEGARVWNMLATLRRSTLTITGAGGERAIPLAGLRRVETGFAIKVVRRVPVSPTVFLRIWPDRVEVSMSTIAAAWGRLDVATGIDIAGEHRFALAGHVQWRDVEPRETAYQLAPLRVQTGVPDLQTTEQTRQLASGNVSHRFPDMLRPHGRPDHIVELVDRARLVEIPGARLANGYAQRRYSACVTPEGNVVWVAGRNLGAYDYDPDIIDPYYWLWPTHSVFGKE